MEATAVVEVVRLAVSIVRRRPPRASASRVSSMLTLGDVGGFDAAQSLLDTMKRFAGNK